MVEKVNQKDWWKHEVIKDNLRKRMILWDKKLHHLDDEMLYYVAMKALDIIEYRENK